MSDENRQWRCPYCDGLNAWQDEVCQICGDGRRAAAASGPEMPKTYTPRERAAEGEAPRRESVAETRTTSYAPEPKKKKGKGGILVAVIIVALAALGGRFLGDSFVRSVEGGKPTARPVTVIETPEPTAAPAEQPVEAVQAPAEQPAAVESESESFDKTQNQSYHEYQSGPYGSVTDNGDGTATVRLLDSIPRNSDDRYWVFYYCLGPDPDAESLVEYRLGNTTGNVYPMNSNIINSRDEASVINVIPGTYTQVVVRTGESYYELEPFYSPEIQRTLPFTVEDANLLVMDSNDDFRDFRQAVNKMQFVPDRDKTVKSVDGLPPRTEYEFTTAEALNDLMQSDKILVFEWIFDFHLGGERYSDWSLEEENKYVFSTMLAGPGFYEAGFPCKMNMSYDNGDFGVQYETDRVFFSFYQVIEKFGGYPAGNYELKFYADGIEMYSYQFSLAGDASQAAEAPAESAQAEAPAQGGFWNFREATDEEIDEVLEQYWYGEDSSQGVWCALFKNRDASRGGLYAYDAGQENNLFFIGSLEPVEGDDDALCVVDAGGGRHIVKVQPGDQSGVDFRLLTADGRDIGLDMSQTDNKKGHIKNALLTVVHGDTATRVDDSQAQDDFELKVGSRGEEVKTIQRALIKMGYLSGGADGIFGKNTEKAVRAFQTAVGVNPSGVVNSNEYNMILLWAQ